jgi:hypothetical protein
VSAFTEATSNGRGGTTWARSSAVTRRAIFIAVLDV